mgnify:CR=1 FL=1
MSDFTIRTCEPGDLLEIAALLGEPADELQWQWSAPQFQTETDCWVAVASNGRIVGATYFTLKQRESRGWGGGQVHPDYRRLGIGRWLLAKAEAGLLAQRPGAAEVPMLYHLTGDDLETANLLLKHGYEPIRQSFSMHIDLDERHDSPPQLPEGMVLRPFDGERDWQAVYAADRAAFEANWGFDLITQEEWRHEHISRPDFDAGLWLLVYAEDAIAGFCLSYSGDGQVGYLDTMGVAAGWRRHGLGAALVRLSLHTFRRRGYAGVRLGVDAGNMTAVRLYRRLGLRIVSSGTVYRKMLRHG